MQEHLRAAPFPAWFRSWLDAEREATSLRTWQPTLVDGLLQTEEYARALLSTRMGASDDEVEQMVAGRVDRQAILHRDGPPLLWVVMDEAVLRRPIGGRWVMAQQLDHLVEMAQQPNVLIQVISLEVGAHEGVNGAFVIADCAKAPSIVYLETALTGLVVDRPEDVAAVTLVYRDPAGRGPTARGLAGNAEGSSEVMDLNRAEWRKSSYSGTNGGQCVEVARNLPGVVAVRDSKDPHGPAMVFTLADWKAFTAVLKG